MDDITEPLRGVMKALIPDEICIRCGSFLFKSDLPQYDHVYPDCDENF